jgi:hypothetical protein
VNRIALLLAASCVASCVLLVSPEEYGQRCRFEGEETACGQCIATQCQAKIDDCCRADSCAPGLDLIEECAKGDRHLCELVESDLQARDPARIALASCVHGACGALCRSGPSVSTTRCEQSSLGRGKTCSCKVESPANDADCSEITNPETVCCAPQSWPAAGQKCTCNTISCNASADGCFCLLFDVPSGSAVCDGAICCLSGDSCRCGSKACSGSAVQVASCSLDTIGCPPNQKRVVSCAASAPP